MLVYMENPIDSTKKLFNLINEFGKKPDTKSILRNQRHSCIPTMKLQKQKSGKKNPICYIATIKIKYLGISLTKDVKDLSSENYTTLKKEIKEGTNKWKHIPCSWIRRMNKIKMAILSKTFIDSVQSLLKYP